MPSKSTKKTETEKPRITSLDNLRGVAVLLMVFAHAVIFFNFGQNKVLSFLSQFGDAVVFTIFLFVSGAVSYLTYLTLAESDVKAGRTAKLLKRSARMLLSYYLIALIASLRDFRASHTGEWPQIIGEILALIRVPSYTEFLIPFIFFTLLMIPFSGFFRSVGESLFSTLILGLLAFLLGNYLHGLAIPSPLYYYTSFFAGYKDWFRFPVLQYLPVFLLGSYWGNLIKNGRKNMFFWAFVFFGSAVIAYWAINYNVYRVSEQFIYDSGIYLTRWPPSVNFLLFGLAVVFFLIMVLRLVTEIDKFGVVDGFLGFLGKNAFLFYFYHIIILYIYRYFINIRIDSTLFFTAGFTILLLVCSLLVIVGQRIYVRNSIKLRPKTSAFPYKRVVLLLFLLLFVVSGFIIYQVAGKRRADVNSTGPEVEGIFLTEKQPYWWNSNYLYNQKLTVTNDSTSVPMQPGSVVSFEIDAATLKSAGKIQNDITDLQVVYFNRTGEYQLIDTYVDSINENTATVLFKLATELGPNLSDERYFVYYGSSSVKAEQLTSKPEILGLSFSVVRGDEVQAKIGIALSRKWILKGKGLQESAKLLEYTISIENIGEEAKNVLAVVEGRQNLTLVPEALGENKYKLVINSEELETGTYRIQTVINGTEFKSSSNEFYVSYPMYVTWSIDYEGFDIKDAYLKSMANLSAEFSMPITHLFNPRIYVASDVSKERADYLTKWVIDRHNNFGDEIGLHLHMHFDMIKMAGVTPRTEPRWGGRANGHDVLTSGYPYDEFKKILEWSKQQFALRGLPEPKTFRAGGWFLDIENLKALNDTGFLIDTSGRETYSWGEQIGLWTLSTTTQPYQPSSTNQNGDLPLPVLEIWEFPNNGFDSTNNELQKLVGAYRDNYQGKPLNRPQSLSYMSHPHWFDIYDAPKIRGILDIMSKDSFAKDNGPIIFSTYQQALKTWED